jgi:hypothetical protein
MRKLLIAALVAGQVPGQGAPAFAQGFASARETEAGAFGGVRLRIPFGAAGREPIRAGLAFAPTLRTEYGDGRARTRLGEGLEFGYRSGRPVSFSIAGRDLQPRRRLGAAQENDRGGGGIPTGAWIAGGLVLVTIVGVAAIAIVHEGGSD